jgi:primosomal protein N' (replication factor Y)
MNSPENQAVVQVALPVPLPRSFDYFVPAEIPAIARGARVLVTFRNRKMLGIVTSARAASEVPGLKLLPVLQVFDECKPLLNGELMNLLEWGSRYYKHPIGEVMFNALPPALRRPSGKLPAPGIQYALSGAGIERLSEGPGRAKKQFELLSLLEAGPAGPVTLREWSKGWRRLLKPLLESGWVVEQAEQSPVPHPRPGPQLTDEQSVAFQNISAETGKFRCHLLDGVTGSGKTEIYLKLIEQVLGSGRQVLVLVPEIGLTPQLVRRFSERLGLVPAVYHSGLSSGQRLAAWTEAGRGQARLMLGTRSALFMPMVEPGLIIMDESHDASFKQQDGFRFSARDVALKRASGAGIPIVLGTATPSLETIHNASQGRYGWNRLRQRATGALTPSWRVMDMRQQPVSGGLLEPVTLSIEESLEKGEQVIVFLNRRGYAPVLLCHECGWFASCSRCDSNLTWHRSVRALVCHHCEHRQGVPATCPDCAADALHGAGEGTQQLEQVLSKRFPEFPLYRFDRDQVSRKGAFESLYEKVRGGGPCILVGTQMLAKGHHFPLVTRVVIVDLDQALYSGDYRAIERLGQLMVQVAGRAGRESLPGEVILQTHHPDHPLLETLFRSGYEDFADRLLSERKIAGLPPFAFQAVLRAEAVEREPVHEFLNRSKSCFAGRGCRVHGPYPAQMERKGGRLRWYLLAQAKSRSDLQAALDQWLPRVRDLPQARQVRWAVDVDPQEF